MDRTDLISVLDRNNLYPETSDALFFRDGKSGSQLQRQLDSLQEVWNLAIDKCKEVVQVSGEDSEDYNLNKELAQDSLEKIKIKLNS